MKVKLKILEHDIVNLMLYLLVFESRPRAEFELLPSALARGIIIPFAVELRLFLFPIKSYYFVSDYYDFLCLITSY